MREVLVRMPGVYLDHGYRHAVRAIRIVDGKRRCLDDETIAAALAEAGVEQSVQALPGGLQSDFAPTSVNKGTGLRALARELGIDSRAGKPLAFAMGDDMPDISMFELAERPFAPVSAARALRDGTAGPPTLKIVGKPYGGGLLKAVTAFLGHEPRRCDICAIPPLSPRTKLITIPLSAADDTRRARLFRSVALAALLLRRDGATAASDD